MMACGSGVVLDLADDASFVTGFTALVLGARLNSAVPVVETVPIAAEMAEVPRIIDDAVLLLLREFAFDQQGRHTKIQAEMMLDSI